MRKAKNRFNRISMKDSKRRVHLVIPIMAIAGIITMFFIWQNNDIVTTQIDYINDKVASDFNGYKIVHISDLHNKKFGQDQGVLLDKIQSESPHIIVITGDLIDRRKYDLEAAMLFIDGALRIAPVYYVSGNHEAWSGKYEIIRSSLIDAGVKVLDDTKLHIESGESHIEILGLLDPGFFSYDYMDGENIVKLEESLAELADDDAFQILLSHRPDLLDIYAKENIDLVFSGHAHGGQFRIPFLGGLIAPDQGLFPEYTSGAHIKDKSTMIVSRGLGNSIIPVRIFNRPEIVVVTLKNEKEEQ